MRYLVKYKFYGKDKKLYKNFSNELKLKFNYYVYCLIHKNKVIYIGQSTNVIGRIKQHIKESTKEFDSWNVVKKVPYGVTAEELLDYEKYYIKLFSPKYNIQHNKDAEKENLKVLED